MKGKIITRNVWLLSLVSLLTDLSSEMLYPIMPLYLKQIGFSIFLIGVLEGLAEATAGLSKGYFGQLSDRRGRRLPFVQMGYFLSALAKPMMAFFIFPLWIFFARTTDRIGKGVRTGARDALLSAEATQQTSARVFGFHRALDTLGAAIGPTLALLYLHFYPGQYRILFLLAFAPALLSVATTFLLREKSIPKQISGDRFHFFSFLTYIRHSPVAYRQLLAGLLFFALINSSDIFLLLMLKYQGASDSTMIGVYIFYNLVYALFAYPAGSLADHFGLKKMFFVGLFFFFLTYAGIAFATNWAAFLLLFFCYGVYAAGTEGIAKAWISQLVPQEELATAIGAYSGLQSVVALLASTMAGVVWYTVGAEVLFLLTAALTLVVMGYFWTVNGPRRTAAAKETA